MFRKSGREIKQPRSPKRETSLGERSYIPFLITKKSIKRLKRRERGREREREGERDRMNGYGSMPAATYLKIIYLHIIFLYQKDVILSKCALNFFVR